MGMEGGIEDLAVFATGALNEADGGGKEVGDETGEPDREVDEEGFFNLFENGLGDGGFVISNGRMISVLTSGGGVVGGDVSLKFCRTALGEDSVKIGP